MYEFWRTRAYAGFIIGVHRLKVRDYREDEEAERYSLGSGIQIGKELILLRLAHGSLILGGDVRYIMDGISQLSYVIAVKVGFD